MFDTRPDLAPTERRFRDHDVVSTYFLGADPTPVSPDDELTQGCTVIVCTFNRSDAVKEFLDSLGPQGFPVVRLILVDASPGDETEQLVRNYPKLGELADSVLYFRVTGRHRGLTRQRNFSLPWIPSDLVVFFDDDVVLLPGCLAEMERVHRTLGPEVVGVGAVIENEPKTVPMFWKLRRLLGVVPTLRAGSYCRSGFAVPWNFLPATDEWVEGQWLRGCAMLWKTEVTRNVGFNAAFTGSSIGEDLDFSLRVSRFGKMIVPGNARLLHHPNSGGRIDAVGSGYTGIANSYSIHRRCLANRTWRDGIWFTYAYGIDTLMRSVNLLRGTHLRTKLGFLRGRLRFFAQLLTRQAGEGSASA